MGKKDKTKEGGHRGQAHTTLYSECTHGHVPSQISPFLWLLLWVFLNGNTYAKYSKIHGHEPCSRFI